MEKISVQQHAISSSVHLQASGDWAIIGVTDAHLLPRIFLGPSVPSVVEDLLRFLEAIRISQEKKDMNWIAHHLRLGGWMGQSRRYAHESKSAVRWSVAAMAHGLVIFATPLERREAL